MHPSNADIEHAREAFDNTENYVQLFVPLAIMFMFYTGLVPLICATPL